MNLPAASLPLAGVRVLDLGLLYAAPLIATLLADQGAEVIKVEPPGGDQYREWEPMWALVGRNKRSLTLDVATPAGRDVLLQLVAHVDVVIENLPRRIAEQRGLTPDAMRAVKPSLVVVSASGFGADGPYADRASNGTVAEAFTGLTGLTGDADGAPQLPSAPLGDAVAAAFGAFGALAGVVRALQTGEGAFVDVTVYEPLLHTLGTTLSSWSPGTPAPGRDGGAMGVPLRGTFATSDGGWIAISASTPRHQQSVADLATAAGVPVDLPLRDRAGRWLRDVTTLQGIDALVAARVSATVVNDLQMLSDDPHVTHRGSLQRLAGHLVARPTPAIDGPERPAWLPALGDANDEVLHDWLGMSTDEVAELRQAGVVAPA